MLVPHVLHAGSVNIVRPATSTRHCTMWGLQISHIHAGFAHSRLAHSTVLLCTLLLSDCVSVVQFDFVKLLDGKALPRSLTDPVSTAKAPKGLLLSGLQETGFIEYMDPGTWHLALYNDGRNLEQVLLHSSPIGEHTFTESIDTCLTRLSHLELT